MKVDDPDLLIIAADSTPSVIELLVDNGADVNGIGVEKTFADPCTALQLACLHGRADNVSVLLAKGADPNLGRGRWGTTPLFAAVRVACRGNFEPLCLLLQHGANPNVPGVLQDAAANSDAVTALLDAGADINLLDTLGQSALWHAVHAGSEPSIALLLKRGANATVSDPFGHAVRMGNKDIVKMLSGC